MNIAPFLLGVLVTLAALGLTLFFGAWVAAAKRGDKEDK